MQRETHIIDAKNKPLGRLATEIAKLLQGKHKKDYHPAKDMGDFVVVKNIEKIKFTGKKFEKKQYFRHSGYLGSGKFIPLKKIFEKNPESVLRMAVYGMLPKNKLRARMIKRLKIEK